MRRRRSAGRFVALYHRLLKSHAWHSLTPLQRCGYIEIAQLYDGSNNGRLAMSTRRMAGLIPCSKNSNVLRELEDAGFIDTIKLGKFSRVEGERLASEYRLTDFKCDVTGELPSRRYNERKRWEPCDVKPKRKAMTDAERARRYRAKRHVSGTNHWDQTVPTTGADSVTQPKQPEPEPRKTAENVVPINPNVTATVPTTGTHIHLTRGYTQSRGPRGEDKTSNVIPLSALPAGHDLCKNPKVKSLPRGWHWCKQEQRVVTDTGIVVPIVDDPLIGTGEQRNALTRLQEWEATHRRAAI